MSNNKKAMITLAILAGGMSTPLIADVDTIDLQLHNAQPQITYTTEDIHTDTSSLLDKLRRYKTDPVYSQALSLSYRDNNHIDDGIGSYSYLRFVDFILNRNADTYSVRQIKSRRINQGNNGLLNNNMDEVATCRDMLLPTKLPTETPELNTLFNDIIGCSISKIDTPYGAVHLDTAPLDQKLQRYENDPLYRKNMKAHHASIKEHVGEMSGLNYVRLLDAFLKKGVDFSGFENKEDSSYKYLDEFYLNYKNAYSEVYPEGVKDQKNRFSSSKDSQNMIDNNLQVLFNCSGNMLPDKMPEGFDKLNTLFDNVLACAKAKLPSNKGM